MSWNGWENNVLLRNEGPDEAGMPRFIDVGMAFGADHIGDARGLAVADFDNDGDLDMIINNNPGDCGKDEGVAPVLYRNDLGNGANWFAIELVGRTVNRDAIGAEATIHIGDQQQLRLVSAGSSYASQQSHRLYYGLADHPGIDSITVRWPGGGEERFGPQPANTAVLITEGSGLEPLALPRLSADERLSDEDMTRGGH
jgi:hypothetical protein